jgi:hypothetical protein
MHTIAWEPHVCDAHDFNKWNESLCAPFRYKGAKLPFWKNVIYLGHRDIFVLGSSQHKLWIRSVYVSSTEEQNIGASSTLRNYTPSDWSQGHHTVRKQEKINTKSPTTAESSKGPKSYHRSYMYWTQLWAHVFISHLPSTKSNQLWQPYAIPKHMCALIY